MSGSIDPKDIVLGDAEQLQFAARVKEAVENAGGNTKVSQEAGIGMRMLARYMSGATEPGAFTLRRIAAATGRSLSWFFGQEELDLGTNLSDRLVMVPRFDVRASAGLGALVPSEEISDYLAFKRDWFSRIGVSPQNAALVTADGDSMEPTIPNRAILMIDTSIREVANGQIYAIRRDGELLVKRVQQRFDGTVVLISDNQRYEREEVPPDRVADLHVVGRVRWIGHDL